ncbi:MAG: RNA 2',3'-cyclic phosphodiesterase [Alphaproteobacteria bacterium]|nr:RNA 2',3'-cyclic phosphodiesterase [Alphaproteobacteria bacterium]
MIRLFVAIDLPEALRRQLASLGGGVPGARWVDADDMHLTLRFIGEVDEGTASDIDEALAGLRAPAVEIRVAGVDHFGEGEKPRLLYAAVERTPPLVHLRDRVEAAVARAGCPREGRKFAPHVTLARLKGAPAHRVQGFVAAHSLFRAEPFVADRIVLYSSFLAHEGAIHRAEAEYPLGQGEGPAAWS